MSKRALKVLTGPQRIQLYLYSFKRLYSFCKWHRNGTQLLCRLRSPRESLPAGGEDPPGPVFDGRSKYLSRIYQTEVFLAVFYKNGLLFRMFGHFLCGKHLWGKQEWLVRWIPSVTIQTHGGMSCGTCSGLVGMVVRFACVRSRGPRVAADSQGGQAIYGRFTYGRWWRRVSHSPRGTALAIPGRSCLPT